MVRCAGGIKCQVVIMNKSEAMSHVISSARYWSKDTIDDSYYNNNLGLECAFKVAIKHVESSHGVIFTIDEILILKKRLRLKI